jgi:hypothetical protein
MTHSALTQIANVLASDLRAFAEVCEDALSLAKQEHQALSGYLNYQPAEFDQSRRKLLPDIESLLNKFRNHSVIWQQIPQSQREHFEELKGLFQNIQGLLMRVIQLDRENQQAMLKRGLVPVKHLPVAAGQRPHYVADLYRRNAAH